MDNFSLVPDSQLIVTRTAFRNNSSKYSINDRTSTFTEVTTLLKGKGIDLDHNRFLILQVSKSAAVGIQADVLGRGRIHCSDEGESPE